MKQLVYLLVVSIMMFIITISHSQLSAAPAMFTVSEQQSHQSLLIQKEQINIDESINHQLSHEDIVGVMDQFMEQLVQETKEDYEVIQYDSVEQLKDSFSEFASSRVTELFVDDYYYEEQGNLYIIPTATPPWFIDGVEYEQKKVESGHYLIKQENVTDFDGEYTIIIELQLKDGNQPYIMDIQYE
ncbi:hypothetical protein [Alkalibacillus silvisoli]|uniref:DUF3993 domain-containing protein n=1 Tax=Alkalibacillus silvisoli TaxID=392823 RepID=A0ABP3JYX1_9BACI